MTPNADCPAGRSQRGGQAAWRFSRSRNSRLVGGKLPVARLDGGAYGKSFGRHLLQCGLVMDARFEPRPIGQSSDSRRAHLHSRPLQPQRLQGPRPPPSQCVTIASPGANPACARRALSSPAGRNRLPSSRSACGSSLAPGRWPPLAFWRKSSPWYSPPVLASGTRTPLSNIVPHLGCPNRRKRPGPAGRYPLNELRQGQGMAMPSMFMAGAPA